METFLVYAGIFGICFLFGYTFCKIIDGVRKTIELKRALQEEEIMKEIVRRINKL